MRRAGRKRKTAPVTLATVRTLAAIPTATLDRDVAPTPERLAKAGLIVAVQLGTGRVQVIGTEAAGIVNDDGAVRLQPAPLDRLHARSRLDEVHPDRNRQLYETGDRLRHHHHRSGLSGFTGTANEPSLFSRTDPSRRVAITEAMESARRQLDRAEAVMHPGDWQAVRGVVIEELTLEAAGLGFGFCNRAAAASVALDRLRRGLAALAELWGYLPPERPVAVPAEPANVNALRSGGARVKVGKSEPRRSVARGFSRARVPVGGHADRPR